MNSQSNQFTRKRFGESKSSFHMNLSEKKRQQVTLTWKNVTYQVPAKKKKQPPKTVLSEVSGCVRPGQLLAIMGSSGAGKTSLVSHLP